MPYRQPQSINADLDKPALMDSKTLPWLASPQPGVERRMLDRDGAEVARATSLVRYAAGSRFPTHTHGAGEEFLVLEGVFSDEHGDYPPGTYVRNPPGSSHAPFTIDGCVILVKLRQMRAQGEAHVVVDTRTLAWETAGALSRKSLFSASWGERVSIERIEPGGTLPQEAGPLEVFILGGSLQWAEEHCNKGTWLRLPDGQGQCLHSSGGCEYWIKRGHW